MSATEQQVNQFFEKYPNVPHWGPSEARSRLPMYNQRTLRVDAAALIDPNTIVSLWVPGPEHFQDRFRKETAVLGPRIGQSFNLQAEFVATPELVEGHFARDYSPDMPIEVVRAVDMLDAVIAVNRANLLAKYKYNPLYSARVIRIDGPVAFRKEIRVGDKAIVSTESVQVAGQYAATMPGVTLEEVEHKLVKGLSYRDRDSVKTELLEGSAQGTLIMVLTDFDRKQAALEDPVKRTFTPIALYDGIDGPIEFLDDVFPEEPVEFWIRRIDQADRGILMANFEAYVNERPVLRALGAKCRVRTIEAMKRASEMQARKQISSQT